MNQNTFEMQYNLKYNSSYREALLKLNQYSKNGSIIELRVLENTRTNLQNRALHLYFKNVADALIEIGYDYIYVNPMDGEMIHIPFTKDLVKNYIWKPLQERIFEIESTTELTTKMIDDILAALSLWLGEKNINVTFPCKIDLLVKEMNKSNKFS